MVALQRANLIDPSSPNPSVETLLHAFLPHKFVDHTHSTAILGLVDQEDSEAICRDGVRQARWASCPTSCRASTSPRRLPRCSSRTPSVEGLILDKHGIFTFGETAKRGL